MTIVGEPASVDTSTSVREPLPALSAEDLELLKELEESVRANGMDGQNPFGQPQEPRSASPAGDACSAGCASSAGGSDRARPWGRRAPVRVVESDGDGRRPARAVQRVERVPGPPVPDQHARDCRRQQGSLPGDECRDRACRRHHRRAADGPEAASTPACPSARSPSSSSSSSARPARASSTMRAARPGLATPTSRPVDLPAGPLMPVLHALAGPRLVGASGPTAQACSTGARLVRVPRRVPRAPPL